MCQLTDIFAKRDVRIIRRTSKIDSSGKRVITFACNIADLTFIKDLRPMEEEIEKLGYNVSPDTDINVFKMTEI